MNILIVEDDYLQADSIYEKVKQAFRLAPQKISTEQQFRTQLNEIEKQPPDLIIMDVMLRWTDPSPDLDIESTPPEVLHQGFYRAGVRCGRLLADSEILRRTPIILYTILERADLENDLKELSGRLRIVHLRKESDPDPLIQLIRDLT